MPMPPFITFLILAAATAMLYPFVHDLLVYLFLNPIEWLGWPGAYSQSVKMWFSTAMLSYVLVLALWKLFLVLASVPGPDPRIKDDKK